MAKVTITIEDVEDNMLDITAAFDPLLPEDEDAELTPAQSCALSMISGTQEEDDE